MGEDMQALLQKYRQSFKEKETVLVKLGINADRDSEALRAYLHKLAGSSGLYGFMDLHQLCLEAERAPDEELLKQYQLVVDWLRKNMNK